MPAKTSAKKTKKPRVIDMTSGGFMNMGAERVERDADGAPCKCGGYADRVSVTKDEITRKQGCGRPWECCLRAFVCRKCKARILIHANAPEASW